MEIINYFKIKCLIEVVIKDINFKRIFKDRYNRETGKEWTNSQDNLEFVVSRYQVLSPVTSTLASTYSTIKATSTSAPTQLNIDATLDIEKEDIKKHNLDCYTYHELYNILVNFNYQKSSIALLNYQNEIINDIKSIHDTNILNNSQFKLDDMKCNQLYQVLIALNNKLSNSVLGTSLVNNSEILDTLDKITSNNNSSGGSSSSYNLPISSPLSITISAETLDITTSTNNSNSNNSTNNYICDNCNTNSIPTSTSITTTNNSNTNNFNSTTDDLKSLLSFINDLEIENEILNKVLNNQEFSHSLFNNCKFYQSYIVYKNTINTPGLTSNEMKSILYLNGSASCFEDHRIEGGENSNKYLLPENHDYISIRISRSCAIQSITFNPFNEKSYIRLGIVYSKLSEYPLAIDLFEASLLLDSSDANREFVVPYLKNAKSKLSIIQRSLNSDGSRNFENETTLMLDEIIHADQVLKKNFKDHLTVEYLNTILPKIKNTRDQLVKSGAINERKALHLNISSQAFNIIRDYDSGKFKSSSSNSSSETSTLAKPKLLRKDCITALGRLVNEDTTLAYPYYRIYQDLNKSNSQDYRLILALLMKITKLPIPFDTSAVYISNQIEMHLVNHQVAMAQQRLGEIYRHGSCGLDIDIFKSTYYFQKSVQNDLKICDDYKYQLGCNGYSYVCLGNIYENGRLNGFHSKVTTDINIVKECDIKNALDLYYRGSMIDSIDFQDISRDKFKKLSLFYQQYQKQKYYPSNV